MGFHHPSGMSPGMHRILTVLQSAAKPLSSEDIIELAALSPSGAKECIARLRKRNLLDVKRLVNKKRGRITLHFALNENAPRSEFGLWKTEIQVLQLVANGKTDGEMAEILGMSAGAVNRIVTRILDVFGAANRVGAVAIGFRKGILS